MRIAVVGGTGTLGSHVVEILKKQKHDVRMLSRHTPEFKIDLATGEGLREALDGCDVVIDASNSSTNASEILIEGTKRLLAAGKVANIKHYICVSIVGCDRLPIGYYRVKTEQEKLVQDGTIPWTIVRATQFHEFVVTLLRNTKRWRVLPLPHILVQPVDVSEVAQFIADVANGSPVYVHLNITGPEILDIHEINKIMRKNSVFGPRLIPIPFPGRFGHALRTGAGTEENPDVRGTITFQSWLQKSGGDN